MTLDLLLFQALDTYRVVHLASRNFASRTRREYLTDLRQLGDYLGSVGVRTVQAVHHRHLQGFLAPLDQDSLANNTRRPNLAAVRSFFQFLESAGYRTGNPAADIVPPDLEPSQP